MAPFGHNKLAVPRFNVSFSDRERARLERLASIRGANLSRVLAEAVVHTLASVELGEPIHYTVPSEQRAEGKAGSTEA